MFRVKIYKEASHDIYGFRESLNLLAESRIVFPAVASATQVLK